MTIGAYSASGGEILVNATRAGLQTDVTITALDTGGYLLCWTDPSQQGADTSGSGIKGQLYDAAGAAVGGEFLINGVTTNSQEQASIASLAGGGFVVVWTDNSAIGADNDRQGIKAQRFDADGDKVGAEVTVNTTIRLGQSLPSVTRLADDGFVISWTDASALAPDTRGTAIRAQAYDAAGDRVGTEFVVNTTTLNSQNYSSLAGLAGGGFVATWTDSSGQGGDTSTSVKAQVFTSAGAKVGTEFLVNTATASTQDQAVAAGLASGGFVIAWRDQSGVGDSSGSGVKAQVYDAAGARIGGEILINSTQLNTQDQPSITALPGGGFAVAWQDNSVLAADTGGYGIKAQVFDDTGNKLGGEFQVNTVTAGNQLTPAIAALSSGELVIGWTDYSITGADTDGGVKLQQFVPTPGGISDILLSNANVSEAAVEDTVIARLSGAGAINATYTFVLLDDSTGGAFAIEGDQLKVQDSLLLDFETAASATLVVQAIDSFGNGFEKVLALAIDNAVVEDRYVAGAERLANTAIANNQQQSAAAALASGNYVVVWADASNVGGDTSGYGIKGQIVSAAGERIGGEFLINTQRANTQDAPAVAALASGGFFVSWTDGSAQGVDASSSGIKGQMFGASGVAVGSEILVNSTTLNAQRGSSTAALSNGGFVVTWTDTSLAGGDASVSSVKAQLYEANGVRVGGEFLVNTQTANRQEAPVASGLNGGGFVIAWADSSGVGGDGSKDSIKAQIYSATGARIGGEFLVNTETLSNQQQATVATLADGRFVIAWADASARGGDLENFAIKGQVFEANGARVATEFLVNTTTKGTQIQPKVSALEDGGFAVAWADYSGEGAETGTAGVKAQLFSAAGERVGGEFVVNEETRGIQAVPVIAGNAAGGFLVGWTDFSGQGDDSGSGIKIRTFDPLGPQAPPPDLIAVSDSLAAVEDETSTYDASALLANDTQAAGLPFSLVSVTRISGGNVAIDGAGAIVFSPFADFSGTALFSYTIADTSGATATGRVTVQVAAINDDPIANDDFVNISQDGAVIAAATLLTNDFDADAGDLLSIIALPPATSGGVALSLMNGNAVVAPGDSLRYLRAGETLVDEFGYTMADASGASSNALVTITFIGRNDTPHSLALSGGAIDENSIAGTVVGTLGALDPDQGETLTYSLTDNAGARFAIEASTGVITVATGAVLDFEIAQAHQIVARVTDGSGAFVESAFTVTVNNLPEPKFWSGDNGVNIFTAPTNDLWTIMGLGGNDILTGNASADLIYGGTGNDTLDGAGGPDTLYGGTGNDIYYVDSVLDQVIEFFGEGSDTIFSSVNYLMPTDVEKLTLLGGDDLIVGGNDLANTITGNSGANTFYGGAGGDLLIGDAGNDTLFGEDGSDFLQGGDGDDRLVGSFGVDELIGGAGADTLVFNTLTTSADRDKAKDFVPGEDKFELDASVFTAFAGNGSGPIPVGSFVVGAFAATPDHHIVYQQSTGNLYYDADGVGGVDQIQIAILSTRPVLTYLSFEVG